jgi:hypothetical protein
MCDDLALLGPPHRGGWRRGEAVPVAGYGEHAGGARHRDGPPDVVVSVVHRELDHRRARHGVGPQDSDGVATVAIPVARHRPHAVALDPPAGDRQRRTRVVDQQEGPVVTVVNAETVASGAVPVPNHREHIRPALGTQATGGPAPNPSMCATKVLSA